MQVSDKLIKPLTEAKYLNADNVSRYRCIMRIFFEHYEKLKYWLYQKEVYEEMIQDPLFADYRPEQCQQDLTMLTGNPHAFDNGTAAGNFLYQMIQMDLFAKSEIRVYYAGDLDPEKEAELQKEPKEKGDVPAMLLAAFLNLFLPAVIALLIFAGLIWLVFR